MSTSVFVVFSLLAALWIGAADPALAVTSPEGLTCEACIVVDGRGRTLWGRRAHVGLPNASTTKMATALVAVREADLEEDVVVSEEAAATGGGGLDLLPGDRYSVEDLLYALLLSSSNDSAVALAEHVSGTEAAFVEEMNRTIYELGAEDTTFVTPHGLDAPGHVASAADLALIGRELLEDPVLAEIVATPDATVTGSNGPQYLENRNALLESYIGAVGVKTGMTSLAGDVLVAAARRRGSLVIAVAMRSLDAASDARALLDFGFARLRDEVVIEKGTEVTEVVLDPGGAIAIATADRVRALPPGGRVRRRVRIDETLGPGLRQGERVGTLELVAGAEVMDRTPLISRGSAEAPEQSMMQSLVEALMSFAHAVGRALGVL
ncbi:MAG: serine hydrolase [Actinomycetota bacterium]|nr:serine hydrolase [Actinomycetota bacterium]